MSVWVRSQDKRKLIKASSIILDVSLSSKETGIKGYFGSNQYAMLGYYKNEKRALEVLDDIQRYLIPSIDMIGKIPEDGKIYGVNSIVSMVYQMPEV